MPRGIRCGLGAGVDRSSGLGIHCSVGIGGAAELGGLAALGAALGAGLGDDAVAVAKFDLEGERAFCGSACEEAVNVKGRRATENVFRAGEDVVVVGGRTAGGGN